MALAAIPVALAYVTKARRPEQAAVFGAVFVAAMLATHVLLGAIAGVGGRWIEAAIGSWWNLAIGPLLIVLGLMWPGRLRVPLPAFAFRAQRPSGPLGAMLFGAVFSVAICPVCTPALLVLIGVALALRSPLFGALPLLAFALGRALPVAAGTSGWWGGPGDALNLRPSAAASRSWAASRWWSPASTCSMPTSFGCRHWRSEPPSLGCDIELIGILWGTTPNCRCQ